MSSIFEVADAESQLGALIDRAAAGEAIVFARDGTPAARLLPFPPAGAIRAPANAMGVTYIADDFDALDPAIQALFTG